VFKTKVKIASGKSRQIAINVAVTAHTEDGQ